MRVYAMRCFTVEAVGRPLAATFDHLLRRAADIDAALAERMKVRAAVGAQYPDSTRTTPSRRSAVSGSSR